MKLGTAKISQAEGLWFVRWMNHGSFLQNMPRAFHTETEARAFCAERGLRVVR
jgi:hypothetical protein